MSPRPVWEVSGVPPGTTQVRVAGGTPAAPRVPCRHAAGWTSDEGMKTCKTCGIQRAVDYSGVWPSMAARPGVPPPSTPTRP
ncbi:DUF6255 family natural product biosynthesis protein [Streptomyces netropsis]|uniref:DUF6255 family natural product biosynthesis protein n=1 Tax=Streptomyces netropsis TaxID=55404 RepID=UPI003BB50767